MQTTHERPRVLYIAGSQRSGSTLLTRVAGEIDGAFAAGELRLLWQRALLDREPCGCGATFAECDVWQRIVRAAFPDGTLPDPRWMIAHQPRTRHLPLMLLPGGQRIMRAIFRDYLAALDALYRAIAEVTGAWLIVDSSKSPLYGHLLGLLPSLDVAVLHLVRDPRGSQYSRVRRARAGHPRLRRYNVFRASLNWNLTNAVQELLSRRSRRRALRLRYEDFVDTPAAAMARVQALIGAGDGALPPVTDGVVVLHTNHTIAGSETRVETGEVRLRLDDRWRTSLDARTRRVVTAVTFPLLSHYGYVR